MPSSKTGQPRNAFYFFMKEVQVIEEKKGRTFHGGLKEVAEFANCIWSQMTMADREPYNEMANNSKKAKTEDLTKKFTSLGESYAELEAKERENRQYTSTMINTIKALVRTYPNPLDIKDRVFYLCHVNYFYKNENGTFVPAEIAMAAFTLQDGIIRQMHSFIDPGKVHLGYRFEATDWSLKTHQIPFDTPDWTCGEKDYSILYSKIQDLMQLSDDTRDVPPIFTMPDSLNNNTSLSAVRSVFQTMCDAAADDSSVFHIYPLPLFFFELLNQCASLKLVPEDMLSAKDTIPTVGMAEQQLERDVFTYVRGLGCEYHENKDMTTFCSLGIVTRWAFTLCDYCCMHLLIELIPTKHCPANADVNRGAVAIPHAAARPVPWNEPRGRRLPEREPIHDDPKDISKETKGKNSFMPTIIDHGKLREKFEAESHHASGGGAAAAPADIRLPKNTSYSAAIKKKTPAPAPQLNNNDFPNVWEQNPRRNGFGRGRGQPRNDEGSSRQQQQRQQQEQQGPHWPVSGRGARPKRR